MSCAVGDCNPDRTQRHGNIPSHAWYHTNSGLTMYCKTMVRYVIRDEKVPQCFVLQSGKNKASSQYPRPAKRPKQKLRKGHRCSRCQNGHCYANNKPNNQTNYIPPASESNKRSSKHEPYTTGISLANTAGTLTQDRAVPHTKRRHRRIVHRIYHGIRRVRPVLRCHSSTHF